MQRFINTLLWAACALMLANASVANAQVEVTVDCYADLDDCGDWSEVYVDHVTSPDCPGCVIKVSWVVKTCYDPVTGMPVCVTEIREAQPQSPACTTDIGAIRFCAADGLIRSMPQELFDCMGIAGWPMGQCRGALRMVGAACAKWATMGRIIGCDGPCCYKGYSVCKVPDPATGGYKLILGTSVFGTGGTGSCLESGCYDSCNYPDYEGESLSSTEGPNVRESRAQMNPRVQSTP